MLRPLAFDADDTLWHNESHYAETQEAFRALLRPYHDDAWIDSRLHDTELRNLGHYGYGIKGFTLSMIETALELTGSPLTCGPFNADQLGLIAYGRIRV